MQLAAWRLVNYSERDRFEKPDDEFPDVTTKRLELIRLIGRAVRVETDDKFFDLIHATCAEAVVFEACRTAEEAAKLAEQIRKERQIHLLPDHEAEAEEKPN